MQLLITTFSSFVLLLLPLQTWAQPIYNVEIVNVFPHDASAYTQGLLIHKGALYESTGHYGESSLRRVDLKTGDVLKLKPLPDNVFGEGIAVWGDGVIALTWREGKGFVYNLETFALSEEFAYPGEGWGLTEDGERLIMSDGTARLRFLDPETMKETGGLTVTHRGKPLPNLNELEWVQGEIWANIWKSDAVARIDPSSGAVVGLIDMRPLRAALGESAGRAEVLNGIAYDRDAQRIFVTGKYWPKLFEIEVVERGAIN